jgi:hypothetical protein
MRLEQFLTDHLRHVLEKHRILTVFDPDGRMLPVVRSLAADGCQLLEVDDDLITAREQALEAMVRVGEDATLSLEFVLYVPRSRPLDQEVQCLDPFMPVILAGGVFPDGSGDNYQALCQRFLPEQTGLIEDMFQHSEPSFAEINSLVVGAGGAPVLTGLLKAEGTIDLMVRFLCMGPKEVKQLAKSNWRKELQTLAGKVLGLILPENISDAEELRRILWRFILFSEFSADLPVPLPTALAAVPQAEPKYHRFIFDLCDALRDRTRAQQTYEEMATSVAEELALETHCGAMEDLGKLDTFAFEQLAFLRSFTKAALTNELEKAADIANARTGSFWIRDSDRAGEWQLASCCVDLMNAVVDLKQVLERDTPNTVAKWLDFQTTHGHRMDALHRVLEHVAHDRKLDPGPLAAVLTKARNEYRELLDRIVRAFQDSVVKEGWPVSGRTRANDVYDQFVRVPWQEGKRVAYFWVDAFRYDLALQLATQVSDRHEATVRAVCAQLPSITKVGMAALLPGAGEDFRVTMEGGELVPVVKGRMIPSLTQRLAYITEVIGPNRFASIELSDLLEGKNLDKIKQTEVLVVRTSDIDQLGENTPGYLAGQLRGAVSDLQWALNRLADAGFQVAVLATDHGFCLFDSASSGASIPKPPDGEWVEVKNRALLGAGQPNAQVVCVEADHVGIRGPVERYVAARGLATFTKGVRYFHEGLSLQECLLPVVQINLKPAPRKGTGVRVDLMLTYRGAQKGTVTVLRPSVEVSVPAADMLFPTDVTFVLEGVAPDGRKVATAAPSPLTDPATGEVRINAGQSIKVPISIQEDFEGTFELRAKHPSTGEIFATLELTLESHR